MNGVASRADRIAWGALLAMVFLVPVAMSNFAFLHDRPPLTYDPFDIVKVFVLRVLAMVALGAWGWQLLRRGGTVRRTPVDWLVLAFLVWAAFTTAASLHPPTALVGSVRRYEGLMTFAGYAVIYFLMLQYADRPARVLTLARALFWSSVVVAGYGVLQYLGWDPVRWGVSSFEANRAFSTFGNPDLLGGFLVFSVPVALALALAEQRIWHRLIYWAGFAANALCLLVSFTRGAWIGAGLSVVLVGVLAWRHRVKMRGIDWLPAGVTAAAGISIIWRSASQPSEVMNVGKRVASILQFGGGSGQTRTEIWQAAVAAIRERPITGWGADSFSLVFPKFKPVSYVEHAGYNAAADNAHDYPLQLAAGLGIPGVAMLYGIFLWTAVRSWRTVFGHTGEPGLVVLGAFWAASAGYLLHLLAGVSVTGSTFLLWVALGALLAPTARRVDVSPPKRGRFLSVAAMLLLALGVSTQLVPLVADHAYVQAQTTPAGKARTEATLKAAALNPLSSEYRAAVGLAYAAEVRAALSAGMKAHEAGDDTTPYAAAMREKAALAEDALRDAIAFSPDEIDHYVMLADLFNLAGETLDEGLYQDAISVARVGIAKAPYEPLVRVQLARALLATGKTAEAVRELEYTLDMDPANGEAALLLAGTYERLGRREEALAILKTAESRRPGQTGIAEAIERLEAGRSDP